MPFQVNDKLVVHGSPVFRAMIESIKDDEDKIAAAAKEYSELRDYLLGMDSAARLGAVFDMMEKNRQKINVSCKAGCAHCCHMKVEISNEEADLLVALIRRDRIKVNRDHLMSQLGLSEKEFREAPREVARCVFLGKNNQCKIYRFRPRPCRNHSVTSDPEECRRSSEEGHTLTVVADYRPELVSSAYVTLPGIRTGGMAEMIYSRLD